MFDNVDEVATVNSLVTTLNDSVNGYRDAAANSEGTSFQELFRSMAEERASVVEDLRKEVGTAGGEAPEDGSFMGKTHQRFLDLKAAITGRDDEAILNEVERGEDYLKQKFEAVLSSEELSPEMRASVERAGQSILEGHDRISQLKHSIVD